MPKFSVRNVLLFVVVFVWAANILGGLVQGVRPSLDDWAALGIVTGVVVSLTKPSPPAGGEGGQPS